MFLRRPLLCLAIALAFTTQIQAQDKAEIERAIETYTKLLKSESEARTVVTEIVAYTDRAPWSLSANLALGQRMIVSGLPNRLVMPTLEACGNMTAALAGNEEGFAELVLRMVALRRSENKRNYVHLSVMDNNGVPVYKLLGEAVGKEPETMRLYALQGKLDSKVTFETLAVSFGTKYKGIAKRAPKGYWLKEKD